VEDAASQLAMQYSFDYELTSLRNRSCWEEFDIQKNSQIRGISWFFDVWPHQLLLELHFCWARAIKLDGWRKPAAS